MIGIGMIGYGGMGRWHSEALKSRSDCRLRWLVGRRPEPTEHFAREFGYCRWSTSLDDMLNDPETDLAVVASPSEDHATMAIKVLESGKHALVEIPIGMSLSEAVAVVEAAQARQRKLGVVYPMRMMAVMQDLRARIAQGQEHVRLIESRFIIKRWKNVGWTGYHRSWTDNLLWHHLGHLIDFAIWLAGSDPVSTSGYLPPPDPRTGTPMDAFVGVETSLGQSLVFVGSYAGHDSICDTLILSDQECYRLDAVRSQLETSSGVKELPTEQVDCANALYDFLDAVRDDVEPMISGRSVLPTMRVLQCVQDSWDVRHGDLRFPGRGAPR